jgi:putative hydrolase of the HAD superfamily
MNLVFDLGGVVVRWEPEEVIAKYFPDPLKRAIVRKEIMNHGDWVELDRGVLRTQDAVDMASRRTSLSRAELATFFERMLESFVPIPETVDLLYRLKARRHAVFCLSNMHTAWIEHLEKTYAFWDVFSGTAISCRLHLCKPDPAIFAYLLNTYQLDVHNTVFIDDMDVNLRAAERFGLRTIKFEDASQCNGHLQKMGCL